MPRHRPSSGRSGGAAGVPSSASRRMRQARWRRDRNVWDAGGWANASGARNRPARANRDTTRNARGQPGRRSSRSISRCTRQNRRPSRTRHAALAPADVPSAAASRRLSEGCPRQSRSAPETAPAKPGRSRYRHCCFSLPVDRVNSVDRCGRVRCSAASQIALQPTDLTGYSSWRVGFFRGCDRDFRCFYPSPLRLRSKNSRPALTIGTPS